MRYKREDRDRSRSRVRNQKRIKDKENQKRERERHSLSSRGLVRLYVTGGTALKAETFLPWW
jgi:hypothetical protein